MLSVSYVKYLGRFSCPDLEVIPFIIMMQTTLSPYFINSSGKNPIKPKATHINPPIRQHHYQSVNSAHFGQKKPEKKTKGWFQTLLPLWGLLSIVSLSQCNAQKRLQTNPNTPIKLLADKQTETSKPELKKRILAMSTEEKVRIAEGRFDFTVVDVTTPSWLDTLNMLPELQGTHGQWSEYILKDAFPNCTVRHIEADPNKDKLLTSDELVLALKKVSADTDGVTFAISPKNMLPNKKIKRQKNNEGLSQKHLPYFDWYENSPVINELESVASRINGWVVVPIGNKKGEVSQYAFANGVLVAGHQAQQQAGFNYPDISEHPQLISHRQPQGFFVTARVLPDSSSVELDMHGNGSIQDTLQLKANSLLSPGQLTTGYQMGSSFSVAKVLAGIHQDMQAIAQDVLTQEGIPYKVN